jgi:hypothetical protein
MKPYTSKYEVQTPVLKGKKKVNKLPYFIVEETQALGVFYLRLHTW